MNWREYQEEAAQFFRNLGYGAEVDASVEGVRSRHDVDVWVTLYRSGLQIQWVIECKLWKRRVGKEKVMALKAIVDDIGADRGLLLSEIGFQKGAASAARRANITLISLAELRQEARGELLSLLTHKLEIRAIHLQQSLFNLFRRHQIRGGTSSTPYLGVDAAAVHRTMGELAILEWGFESARLGDPPFAVGCDDSGAQITFAATIEEFVQLASDLISRANSVLEAQPNSARLTLLSQQARKPPAHPVSTKVHCRNPIEPGAGPREQLGGSPIE
jgi:Restriction endonuclease